MPFEKNSKTDILVWCRQDCINPFCCNWSFCQKLMTVLSSPPKVEKVLIYRRCSVFCTFQKIRSLPYYDVESRSGFFAKSFILHQLLPVLTLYSTKSNVQYLIVILSNTPTEMQWKGEEYMLFKYFTIKNMSICVLPFNFEILKTKSIGFYFSQNRWTCF